jgi:SPP1 gp7 family putative phage head morphogenesis protein
MYETERVRHTRNASWANGPAGELYGTGAIESLAREINADINAQKLASNSSAQGRPDVLLSPKDEADIWGSERRREILEAYRNMSQRGGCMVLSGQIDVTPLNLTPRDMEFSESRRMARESISAVLGVPSTVLGLPDANYATARQSTLNYWSVQTKRGSKMSIMFTSIAKLFDPEYRIEHDYSNVEALQSVRTDQLVRIQHHMDNGMTAAEAYRYEGLEDSPLIDTNRETPAEDIGDEEHQDTRGLLTWLPDIESPVELRGSVGDKDPTNFPDNGDNLAVSLDNSEHRLFPLRYAQDLKDNWPDIWNKGGNILGNKQFNRLVPIANRDNRTATTITEEKAIRLREAWIARHIDDFRLAGVVAQIKWLAVGSRGTDHMRSVIEAEKKKQKEKSIPSLTDSQALVSFISLGIESCDHGELDTCGHLHVVDEQKKKPELDPGFEERTEYWNDMVERKLKPIERKFQRVVNRYFREARERYVNRLNQQLSIDPSIMVHRAIFDWAAILAESAEKGHVLDTLGKFMRATWEITAQDSFLELYRLTGRPIPPDTVINTSGIREKVINQMAERVTNTTTTDMQKIIMDGLAEGKSRMDIASKIESSAAFSSGRAKVIAQTEGNRAINMARQASWEQNSTDLGVTIKKEWISSRDDKVRPSHRKLEGQVIDLNDEYHVEGKSALTPGDFNSPGLDINCRCVVRPIV